MHGSPGEMDLLPSRPALINISQPSHNSPCTHRTCIGQNPAGNLYENIVDFGMGFVLQIRFAEHFYRNIHHFPNKPDLFISRVPMILQKTMRRGRRGGHQIGWNGLGANQAIWISWEGEIASLDIGGKS